MVCCSVPLGVWVVGDAVGTAVPPGRGGREYFFERLTGRDRDQLLVRVSVGERLERLVRRAAALEVGMDQPGNVILGVGLGHAPNERPSDRGVVAEAAAQVDLVGLELLAGDAA